MFVLKIESKILPSIITISLWKLYIVLQKNITEQKPEVRSDIAAQNKSIIILSVLKTAKIGASPRSFIIGTKDCVGRTWEYTIPRIAATR